MTERQVRASMRYSFRPPRLTRYSSPGEAKLLTDAYDGGLAYTDVELRLLFDELGRRNLLDNTIVVWAGEFGRTPMVEIRDPRDDVRPRRHAFTHDRVPGIPQPPGERRIGPVSTNAKCAVFSAERQRCLSGLGLQWGERHRHGFWLDARFLERLG
jgi:arylsulfatase A-like enzyme